MSQDDDRDPEVPTPPTPEDPARAAILARRRRFVAVALTTAGVATTSACDQPRTCLNVAPVQQGGAPPMPCLAPVEPDEPDAGAPDAGSADDSDAGSPDAGSPDAGATGSTTGDPDAGPPPAPPRPCLKPVLPPRACLKIAMPKPDLGTTQDPKK
ncbi:MAG: hypothetical protein R3B72_07670 [Polyangiaceae bacterium]